MHGARPAFQSLHDEFRPRVLRYLARLVGDREAEDLAQVVMLKVSQALPRFRGDSSVSTWIYRIASNAALDELRRRRTAEQELASSPGSGEDDASAPQTGALETEVMRDEMSACIRDFIARLPDNYRAVLALSDLEGFTKEEIAAILGLTLDNVKIRLHRAREKLRSELQAGCRFSPGEDLASERKPAVTVKLQRRPVSFSTTHPSKEGN